MHISGGFLKKLYERNNIKFRLFKWQKPVYERDQWNHIMLTQELQAKAVFYLEMGYNLVWLDEATFSQKTVCNHSWKRPDTVISTGRKNP